MLPTDKNSFVIKHVFPDFKNLQQEESYNGEQEHHFGVPWRLQLRSSCITHSYLIYLECFKTCGSDKWEIKTISDATVGIKTLPNPYQDFQEFTNKSLNVYPVASIHWSKIQEYLKNDNLEVEVHVIIASIFGINPGKTAFFNELGRETKDVTLYVKKQKFYVGKSFLMAHSTYFDDQLCNKRRVVMDVRGVEPQDFQNFLEAIYGETEIDANKINGILCLAESFQSKTAFRRCEEFLIEKSNLPLIVKFHAAEKYKMDKLKEKCLTEMDSAPASPPRLRERRRIIKKPVYTVDIESDDSD